MAMERAVIFDMDGVLFDTERLMMDCWSKIGEKYGYPDICDVMTECIGTDRRKTKEIVESHYGEAFCYEERRAEASGLLHAHTDEAGLPFKKGVREVLSYCKDRGVLLGLASSTRVAVVTRELQDAGLYDFFKVVIGGDLLQKSKPAPDIYLMTAEAIGVSPENCYAVEDSYNGITSAYRAGMRPIMVPDMLPATAKMHEMSVAVLDDLLAVRDFLRQEGL